MGAGYKLALARELSMVSPELGIELKYMEKKTTVAELLTARKQAAAAWTAADKAYKAAVAEETVAVAVVEMATNKGEVELQLVGPLAEIEAHKKELQMRAGVYLMCCSVCGCVLYVGQSYNLYGRIREHAFSSPYGAVDIVIGEVLNPDGKKKWETLCAHLKAAAAPPCEEIAARLTLHVSILLNKADRDITEQRLFMKHPNCFGNNERVWRDKAEVEFFREYKRRKARQSSAV